MGIAVQVQDAVYGRGAADLRVRLDHDSDGVWTAEAEARTDEEGSIRVWSRLALARGLYRAVFDSDPYFVALGLRAVYPEIVLTFRLLDECAMNTIMVLITPHFYSACFGSLS
ncbi:hydroxyisourate hydrolase [Nonomuraea sp. NPDC004297]